MLSERVEDKAERQKHQAVNRIDNVVSAIERFASELHDNDEDWLGDKAASAAKGVRNVSRKLRQKNLEDLTQDARRWSQNPALFLGGAFALGLTAGRFIKSSSRRNGHGSEQHAEAEPTEERSPRQFGGPIQPTPTIEPKPTTEPTLANEPEATGQAESRSPGPAGGTHG